MRNPGGAEDVVDGDDAEQSLEQSIPQHELDRWGGDVTCDEDVDSEVGDQVPAGEFVGQITAELQSMQEHYDIQAAEGDMVGEGCPNGGD
jgi:hypothetical protein